MFKPDYKKIFLFLLIVTFVLNLAQALFTGILSDEAYYGLYGANLSWGYFDHPPMVGLLVKLSSLIFSGTLGIRFMSVVVHVFTILLTWKLIEENHPDTRKVAIFFLLVGTSVMFSAYGFVTTPDSPLLFFVALFLYAYRNFLKEKNWGATLLLSVAMAGMIYSKYQAAIVIALVVFSNLRLLRNGKFWLSGIFALVLLFPHFYWQYIHDFPGFKYHLVDRSGIFKWRYIYEYIPNQMASFNPFIFCAIIFVLLKFKAKDTFERALYFLIIGFIAFFWITGFRGHVEPHWTVSAAIPTIILLFRRSFENKKLMGYVLKVILPSFLLVLVIRLLIIVNDTAKTMAGFDKRRAETEYVGKLAGNVPVLYIGSFQSPSTYSFFNGKKALLISTLDTRRTQFDFWQWETQYQNRAVFVCADIPGKSRTFESGEQSVTGFFTDSLQTVTRMRIKYIPPANQMISGQNIVLDCTIQNPYTFSIDFNHQQFPVELKAAFLKRKATFLQPVQMDHPIGIIQPGESINRTLSFVVPKLGRGKYQFGLSLTNCLGPSLNSKYEKVNLE
ncbi:MAG: glycosyltransferase family 39 protein [Bacteroidia bacterium]|nr:glycosyltransferase family 39 protein [Bacteroidia bacterium]